MQMREAAERVLFAGTLEEKLQLSPPDASDDLPGPPILTPDGPGRPDELRIVEKGVRATFPGINKLDDDRERGRMLHFLANHELLAAELMALVLLKFPDAPKEYRAGVYEAMREEQMHTMMYLRRMKECGVHFGELPLNNYFWRLIAPMETPMDFVTRLNLTFEQANLDFSKHYAGLFRQVGDTATAGVLEKIYQDEIGHVGHGVKWFRKWKDKEDNDWNAFNKALVFPFSASKAKGIAPFNAEGRRLAGFDDDFIEHLEVYEQSRGRTPVVHWFNPNAELEVAARRRGQAFHPKKMSAAMEHDAEMVMLAWSRRDDVALVRQMPSKEHLAYLKRVGFQIPEMLEQGDLGDRKLGGMRPWAWSPDASETLQPLSIHVPESARWPWRESVPDTWLSKEIGVRLLEKLDVKDRGLVCSDLESAMACLRGLPPHQATLIKGCYGCAGRDHLRVPPGEETSAQPWLSRILATHGSVVIEPYRHRVADFSALYEMDADHVKLMGMTVMENDSHGRFLGSRVAPKWGSILDEEVATFLFREADVMRWYQEKIPGALRALLPGYVGPLGVDAMVYRNADGSLGWSPVVELNVRMTMGRVALEMMAKSRPGATGHLRFLRKSSLQTKELQQGTLNGGCVLLNDPNHAREFLVTWEVEREKASK
ncbi:ferritin-like domain-containing protein [Haloferula sp.]|uniref:ferritin-like domain-containing protein n=1 Tax=Haloferula sp. TaxID=2497595 RepID=UPI003C769A0B